MNQDLTRLIGKRLRAARDEANLNQSKLAALLGFKDHQIVSSIETGMRKVSTEELMKLISIFDKDLNYFTDPFLLPEKDIFSWRVTTDGETLTQFESSARGIVALYQNLLRLTGSSSSPIETSIPITKGSSFEDVQCIAESLVQTLELGDTPATTLADVIENRLNIPVFFVDAPQGISGAACKMPGHRYILINRGEPEGRRNYDLAHELFHLLTWDNGCSPKVIDYSDPKGKKDRIEGLADVFASSLLLPVESVRTTWEGTSGRLVERLELMAQKFKVSVAAVYWCLHNRNLISKNVLAESGLDYETDLKFHALPSGSTPAILSRKYADLLKQALGDGLISQKKVCSLLSCRETDLESMFAGYGLPGLYEI